MDKGVREGGGVMQGVSFFWGKLGTFSKFLITQKSINILKFGFDDKNYP
jgi:hypothetical protein